MAQGKRVKRRKSNAGRNVFIGFVAVIAVAAVAVVGMGAYVAGRDTIFPNVTVAGVDVGGMSYDMALSTLMDKGVAVPSGVEATAVLTGTVSVTVTSDEAGLTGSLTEAVDQAYAYGRDGSFFANLGTYMKSLSGSFEVYGERAITRRPSGRRSPTRPKGPTTQGPRAAMR